MWLADAHRKILAGCRCTAIPATASPLVVTCCPLTATVFSVRTGQADDIIPLNVRQFVIQGNSAPMLSGRLA